MNSPCNMQAAVERWSKLGSDAPCPAALTEHAAICTSCNGVIADIMATRSLFRGSEREFSEAQQNRVLNNLMSRTQHVKLGHQRSSATGPWWTLAAAFSLIIAASAFAAFNRANVSKSNLDEAPVAEVTLVDSAIGHTLQSGQNEVYELVEGFAEFSVKHLRAKQRYRVLVGTDEVEVRGTRFQVVAKQRQLQSVRVLEGRVQVNRRGQNLQLEAGQKWVAELTTADIEAPAVASTTVDSERSSSDTATAPISMTRKAMGKESEPNAELYDVAFKAALARLRSGDATGALSDFETLLNTGSIDAGRRADVIYWSAVAANRRGNFRLAEKRLRLFLTEQPNGWHTPDAALMLGELLVARGDTKFATPWLERAAHSNRPNTSTKAQEILARIRQK